ncbi:MAG: O-antigen ligase family protein [Chloroflexi bacterium]|nr:O-antigen ligase family protein [Chloroflexota bacterium]
MKAFVYSVNSVVKFLWAAALVSLPVTSYRWFPFLGDSTLVRPLALYPLALLLPLLLLQAVRKQRPFPWTGSAILLGAFALAVLAATSFGVLIAPIPLRGQHYFDRAVRALVTLVIGLAFFISAVWMNRGEAEVKFTLRWMLVGFGVELAWSGLQAVTFYTGLLNKEMVTHWQLAFSMRELVRTNRISGLAYEPAWLAGQIVTMYLPLLFAALLTKMRLTRFRWLEPALLGLSALLLLATYSRGGILIGVGVTGLVFLLVGRDHLRSAWAWYFGGFRRGWLLRVGLIVLLVAVLAGAFAFLNKKKYVNRLWDISADSLSEYLVDINVGGRSAYATGAMAAFEEHPLSGVGLGASGFWVYDNLPDWTLTTVPEIAKQLNPESKLFPNPKNLYVRLLAETGLIGFVFFFIFLFSSLADSLSLYQRGGFLRFLGIAGLFAWLAIALYNVTQDSLATPNIWLLPGILAGISISNSPLAPLPKREGKIKEIA